MARIVYSALVESIRGSIGGTTFQKNAYGYTVKKKPNIIFPARPTQNRQKVFLQKAVKQWRAFTSTVRSNWSTFASTYPQYSQHNPSAQLSGFALYTRWAVLYQLWSASGNIAQSPVFTLPDTDTLTLGVTLTAGVLELNMTDSLDSEEWDVIVMISRRLSGAQQFVGSKLRFLIGSPLANLTDDVDITSAYVALFGALPADGDELAINSILVHENNIGFVQFNQPAIVTVA